MITLQVFNDIYVVVTPNRRGDIPAWYKGNSYAVPLSGNAMKTSMISHKS